MSIISEKVAYLSGLADGMKLDEGTNEGKLLKEIISVLGEIADEMEFTDESMDELSDKVYDLEDGRMVIVTTDRISAFDVILPTLITDKGKVLNALSNFWFSHTADIVKNHMISSDIMTLPKEFQKPEYEGRTILVKKIFYRRKIFFA